jgi:hypothetical protein
VGRTIAEFLFHAYGLIAQQAETIYDKDINVTFFEGIRYPSLVRQARIQVTVVIRAALDSTGKVTSGCDIGD